ncbi:MAG: hypothetical protein ACON49_04290 [Candidatus Puniceispirillaceae bacterium]
MKSGTRSMILLVISFLAVLVAVMVASYDLWVEMGVISLGFHGWVAIIAGSLGSVILGAGLMWLSFYSSRSGHDEKAAEPYDEDPDN